MEKRKICFSLNVYGELDQLPQQDLLLLKRSREAVKGAYAPYSRFRVGAAVLLETGEIVIGSNQENASFPSGLCAERVAVFQAVARFPGTAIRAIAITVSADGKQVKIPAAPCGNCRQAIYEYEKNQKEPIRLLLEGAEVIYECPSISSILPLGFDGKYLP